MKRKFIALIVAATMVTSIGLCNTGVNAYAADNGNAQAASEIKVGQEINGFKVIESRYDEKTKSTKISLEHMKSGAKMIVIKNSDKNRGFSVGFNTPCENDKGINHIIEHSVLSGSGKYPSNDLAHNLSNNTYTSYANAQTSQVATLYPVCSQSEEQLMKDADVYMDCVYNPLLLKDKRIFDREGWHYDMKDPSSELEVNGVVYSEMKGSMSDLDAAATENDKQALFSDTNQKYNSGGNPDSILDLSYEEVLNTYKKNYHPANSFMVLYGDVDYAGFLKMLDENYLSKYDKKDFTENRQAQGEFNKLIEKDCYFPEAKDSQTTGAQVDVNFAMDDIKDIPVQDYSILNLLQVLLNDKSSEFMKALETSGIGKDYSVNLIKDGFQPFLRISAENADPAKKKEFYDLVINELKKTSENGVNKESAVLALKSKKFANTMESGDSATSAIYKCFYNYVDNNDPFLDDSKYDEEIKDNLDNGLLENAIKDYLLNNKRQALVTTTPKPGLLEENEENLRKKLAGKKASMNADEINNLVEETKKFEEWNSKEPDQDVINSLKVVKTKDIPVDVNDYNVKDNNVDGIRILTAEADSSDIGYLNITFDESHLTNEELHYLEFYGDLLSNVLPTKDKDINTMRNEIKSKTEGFNARISEDEDDKYGKNAHATFDIGSYLMKGDLKDVLNIYSDELINSVLDKTCDEYIKAAINNEKASMQRLSRNPSGYMKLRAMAYSNIIGRYTVFYTGIDYDNFIQQLEKEYNENPQSVIDKITAVKNKAFNKNNLVVKFAGNKELRDELNREIPAFTETLGNKTYEKAVVNLPVPQKREALSINSQVQYLSLASNLKESGIEDNGSYKVFAKLLKDKYLLPQLRYNGGAYSVGDSLDHDTLYVRTGDDKDCFNSLNVIKNSGDYINSIMDSITPEMIDNYIISAYEEQNWPQSELDGARSMLSTYKKTTLDDTKKLLNEIKSTDINSVKAFPDVLDKLTGNSNYVIAASPDEIEAHKDLFDAVIRLNNK